MSGEPAPRALQPQRRLPAPADAPSRRMRVRPLLALVPYVMRYRGQVAAALVALLIAAARHAGRAARGAPHDRFRLFGRAHRADRPVFRRDDRGRGRARGRERAALLPRHHHRRARRRRPARGGVRAPDRAVARLLRHRQDRRAHLAAHRRHDADQERGRLVGLGRAAQHRAVHRLVGHDGGDEPAALLLRDRWRSR